MADYKSAEQKTDSMLLSLVRKPVSLLILVAGAVAFFVAGALIF